MKDPNDWFTYLPQIVTKNSVENDYYKWIWMPPNKMGLTHWLIDKKKDEYFIVHATGHKFKAEKKDEVISAFVTLGI